MEDLLDKLRVYGEDSLSVKELLGIAISTRKTKDNSIKIAEKLINNNKDLTGDLGFLTQITINELVSQGLTLNQAYRLKAIAGIFKKMSYPMNVKKLEMNSSSDVADWFIPELRYEKSEIVKLVILTNRNVVLKILTLSKGTTSSATISPKDILSEPVKMKATRIILVHNHPSRRLYS